MIQLSELVKLNILGFVVGFLEVGCLCDCNGLAYLAKHIVISSSIST